MTEQEWLESDDPAAMLEWLVPAEGRNRHGTRANRVSSRKLRLFACAILRSGEDPHPFQVYCADAAERWIEGEITLGQCRKVWLRYVNVTAWPHGAIMPENAFDWAMSLAGSGLGPPASPVDAGQHPVWAALLRDIVGNPFRPVALPRDPGCAACGGTGRFLVGSGEDAEPVRCRCCPWLTPTVTRLALAAYQERGRGCPRCKGRGTVRNFLARGTGPGLTEEWEEACPACAVPQRHTSGILVDPPRGTGRIDDGTLDAAQLAILSDAMEEAGCHDQAVLSALRSPGPKFRGFWALDLLLGLS